MTFNQAVKRLIQMRREGKRGTKEYDELVEQANRLNPNPETPLGFYLMESYADWRD